jgi:hypothetical protein
MRRITVTIGLAVLAVCAFGALAVPAFAKEKLVFGEFQGSVTGKNLETEPQPVQIWKEDKELEVEGLKLGNYKFYTTNAKAEKNESKPCLKSPKVTGVFQAEEGKVNKSDSLPLDITFKKCISHASENGVGVGKPVTFTLPIKLQQNHSAESGPKIAGVEIPNKTIIRFKGALSKCPVVIPQQVIPKNKPEKEFEETVSYTNETPEPIENWEKSTKLKEQYPSGVKERLEVEFEEKFKGIITYVKATPPCEPAKGEENPKLIEETNEGPNHGEYNGWLEYESGHIFMDIEGLEIKGGELSFVG